MERRKFLTLAGVAYATNLLSPFEAIAKPFNPQKLIRRNTFYTKGKFLYDSLGNKIILRGINLPLLDDWNFPQTDKLTELAKTGANAVRIQWYKNYGQVDRPNYSIADLDKFLTKCKANRIIPIVFLGDLTCKSDVNLLNSELIPWWTSQPVLSVLKKHQKYLIINLANELGVYRWSNNPTTALNSFKDAYKNAIAKIRQHLQVPIMIDAPDCGMSIEVFTKIGKELTNSDRSRNLLFSGHAYWAGYNGIPHLKTAIDANLPIVFGEIANKQDENINNSTSYCYYDLDGTGKNHAPQNNFTYQKLLPILKQQQIGWFAWSWWKDRCTERQMAENGDFSNLTPYGKDIVNNSVYGLKVTAKKSKAF
ncbi:MAG: glycoside hydrolase family 5 protein [Richelia sp. SL_2_1]|nr:glycoside hydrolase family 5 protein [Richelia sp. SM1_7_0]NJO26992.1 glycoside hydrolase family 5 protein [Richelia sp. SL_2_1]